MLRSLVGSEMCIRDRFKQSNGRRVALALAGMLKREWVIQHALRTHPDDPDVERQLSALQVLSIPGHKQKFTGLGTALRSLSSLTSLDLSRNSLVELNGLEQLSALKSLNVYYNGVQDVASVRLLRQNLEIRSLDLRLNPVSRLPNYRLHVCHLVPWITSLDERDIRDSERRKAVELFGEPLEMHAELQLTQHSFVEESTLSEPEPQNSMLDASELSRSSVLASAPEQLSQADLTTPGDSSNSLQLSTPSEALQARSLVERGLDESGEADASSWDSSRQHGSRCEFDQDQDASECADSHKWIGDGSILADSQMSVVPLNDLNDQIALVCSLPQRQAENGVRLLLELSLIHI
eukprot:TRINITY_DN11460_c0_g1_i1.p1 TRINITY_DN11460_c0_g1~~TRINITY_DN11460_c0_g1_i1.p1  ORF type:complete len:351 (-),score=88.87 TRINITY_DN11460_c0_g1_i1:92-1144(-)